MAMNIPVNLMATAVPPTQVQTAAAIESVTASMIQPAMGSAGARGATADGGAGSSAGKGQAEQRVKALMQQSSSASAAITPDRAEPNSVVTAQASPASAQQKQPAEKASVPQVRQQPQSELDRYAPPNPLPTAPILQLAASYATLVERTG